MQKLNQTTRQKICSLWIIAMLCSVPIDSTAFAQGSSEATPLSLDVGLYDLLRAHSDRTVVTFGRKTVVLQKYVVIKMLMQYFTMASEVTPGGAYKLTDNGESRTLVIY